MSAPAANARSLPVRMTQRTVSSRSNPSSAPTSSFIVAWLRAFSTSGRLRVTMAMLSSVETRMFWYDIVPPRKAGPETWDQGPVPTRPPHPPLSPKGRGQHPYRSPVPGPRSPVPLLEFVPTLSAKRELFRQVPCSAGWTRAGWRTPPVLGACTLGKPLPDPGRVDGPPLMERLQSFLRLRRSSVQRQPVTGVSDSQMPRKIPPEIQLLLCVPRHLGQCANQLLGEALHGGVELAPRDDLID